MRKSSFGASGGPFQFNLDVTPVLRKLLIAHIAVWGVQVVFGLLGVGFFQDLFALDPDAVLPWRPWQLVTYMFLHSAPDPAGQSSWSILHIVFNMLILAFMGGPVERQLGARRFLRLYFLCGIAGGLVTLLPPFRAVTLGASGAVYGVLTAFGLLFPNAPVYIFLLFAVPAKWVVIALAVMQVLYAIDSPHAGVSYISHVGGMAAAYLWLRGWPRQARLASWWQRRSARRSAERRARSLAGHDEILDKMNREGRESLTREEWRALLEASKRLRGDR